jgi:hypothetical protein
MHQMAAQQPKIKYWSHSSLCHRENVQAELQAGPTEKPNTFLPPLLCEDSGLPPPTRHTSFLPPFNFVFLLKNKTKQKTLDSSLSTKAVGHSSLIFLAFQLQHFSLNTLPLEPPSSLFGLYFVFLR